ncbi:MAG TPA: hypothetical protein VFL91_16300 [Thermomicrobiales bacterium]|nr:hypothetical protein [Thermomicrobiales bacterium]
MPAPFDLRTFCRAVEAERGRPVYLHPIPGMGSISGLWLPRDDADYVFYEERTSPLHRRHIILHELSHVRCGHRPPPVTDADLLRILFPRLTPAAVRRALRRADYTTEQEREAELLATLLLERLAGGPRPPELPADPAAARLLRRLEASLADGEDEP